MLEHTGLNKLEGLEPIYVINMERSVERKNRIEKHFKEYSITNYKFINAIDGSKEDLSNFINNVDELSISKNEAACGLSHLKAIRQWLEESDSEYAIFMEDDISLETSRYWDFSWKDFYNSVSQEYDILQLAITNNFIVNPRLHLREALDWCLAAYLIKRRYAEKLVKRNMINDKYVFGKNRGNSVPEAMLYGGSLCYSIPLFTYTIEFESSLNQYQVNTIHKSSREQTLEYWQNNSMFKPDLM